MCGHLHFLDAFAAEITLLIEMHGWPVVAAPLALGLSAETASSYIHNAIPTNLCRWNDAMMGSVPSPDTNP